MHPPKCLKLIYTLPKSSKFIYTPTQSCKKRETLHDPEMFIQNLTQLIFKKCPKNGRIKWKIIAQLKNHYMNWIFYTASKNCTRSWIAWIVAFCNSAHPPPKIYIYHTDAISSLLLLLNLSLQNISVILLLMAPFYVWKVEIFPRGLYLSVGTKGAGVVYI